MLFIYKAVTKEGLETEGEITAQNQDSAVNTLQKSGLVVISVRSGEKKSFFEYDINILNRVSQKEIAMISRQLATLLEAHVPALRSFNLIASESDNPTVTEKLTEVADDIQNGVAISDALFKHPSLFSDFYVNMVRAGEESGKLPETFTALADQLERSYDLFSKTRGALIYPVFIIITFIVVMIFMLLLVIPNLTDIILQSGQEVPFYTKVVIGLSSFLINYGVFVLVFLVAGALFIWRDTRGTTLITQVKLRLPVIGNLYRAVYLARITDNMHTMLANGVSMVRGIEITANIVGNDIYKNILIEAEEAVKGGTSLSTALSVHPEIPQVMIQMIRVGEETGEIGNILEKLSVFYKREVYDTISTVVAMIEPMMIVVLGVGVGGVLAAVIIPIYQIAGGI